MPINDVLPLKAARRDAIASLTKVTRSTKQDSWISCDCCKHGGFTSSQYSKICRDGLWIKCVVCCFQQILTTEKDDSLPSAFSSATSLIIESAKNRISKAQSGKVNKRNQSKEYKPQASVPKVEEGNAESCLSQGVDVITVSSIAEAYSTDKENQFAYSTPYSTTGRDSITVDHSLYSADVLHRTDVSVKDVDSNIPCYQQKSVTINHDSDVSKILIVDNIDAALDFSSSRRILQEIHLYFPSVKIEFAYSLAKGGIAIHTTCEKDRDLLLAGLPAESFGRGVKHLPNGSRDYSVFVKGVDTTVDVCQLAKQLQDEGITGSTVVLTCCKGDSSSQWETPFSDTHRPKTP